MQVLQINVDVDKVDGGRESESELKDSDWRSVEM